MSTSKPNIPSPAPSAYTRFIPREELGDFASWSPETFEKPPAGPADKGQQSGVRKPTLAERAAAEVRPPKQATAQHAPQTTGTASSPTSTKTSPVRRPVLGGVPGQAEAEEHAAKAPPPSPGLNVDELVQEARLSGYQDGYRNGLVALETYKQTQAAHVAQQIREQVGSLANDFHQRLESLEQQLAGRIAGVALELARQVVRSELRQRPEVVVEVAEEAMGVLLASARQIVLHLNPDDHALAQGQLGDMLTARGARLMPDHQVTRGGCLIESDISVVDATVESRWDRAAAALGHEAPWNEGREARGNTETRMHGSGDDPEDGNRPVVGSTTSPQNGGA